jgi:hypothetical protein
MSIRKSRVVLGSLALGVALLGVVGAANANTNANTEANEIRVASLEVKQRIQSMEQINVTAEKSVDESAPAASAAVSALLEELAGLEETNQRDYQRD